MKNSKNSRRSRLTMLLFAGALSAVALVSIGLSLSAWAQAPITLVATGSTWKFLDNGTDQGTAWISPSFDDSAWASGPAQLGYGDGDEATVVGFGPDPNAKYVTTYFRHAFTVADASIFGGLTLRVRRDDGVVVYLNGTEVFRDTMPAGAPTYTTHATTAVGDDGGVFLQASINPALLATGTNVLSAEIHQANGTSTDISFDLELTGASSPTVTRGPYLQIGTPSSVVVRWRTSIATDSRVRFGLSASSLDQTASEATSTTEHSLTLAGLQPDTTYYYAVGSTTEDLAGADANHFFVTSPAPGSAKPTRVWVLGDAGTADANQAAVRNAYYTFNGSRYTDLWLMLGDNAYETGSDTEYQNAVFNMYPQTLRQSPLWPTIGNHDTAESTNPAPTIPYYEMFTLPMSAEAGGVASGTEDYYSFDYGNIHFVCLDSMTSSRASSGPMLTWLQADLAANTQQWLIAFWHHPPYTKGSHNSDTETALVEMRANALPILEAYGVDLVLSGHSHSYERSYLIDGHYGVSATFTSAMQKDAGDGSPTGNGAYSKLTLGPGAHEGAVYAVAGSSGRISGGTLNHPAMFISLNNLGSMVLDVDGDHLDAKFIRENGVVADNFTIVKGSVQNVPPAVSITSPAEGANYNAPATVSIAADATDSDGTVTQVDFYQGGSFLGTDTTAPFSFNWTNVPVGVYALTAKATDNNGAETTSSAVNITVNAVLTPAAPTGLTATAVSTSQINLSWTDNASNEDGFKIERSNNGVSFAQIATVGPNVTTFSSGGLQRNKMFHYRVRAFNASGNSAYSNTANAKTFK